LADDRALELLTAAHLVRPVHLALADAHIRLELADQAGILDPATTEPLVELIRTLLPDNVAGVAVGTGIADIVIGYLLGKQLGVPTASIANQDGMLEIGGRLPASGPVWLVISVLDEPATIAEFAAACSQAGAEAAGVVALVDRLTHPDIRVRPLLRWADHTDDPDQCPVCARTQG
jgi:hypothetical protein